MITRLNAVLLLLIAPRAAAVVARCANATDCTDELMQAINTWKLGRDRRAPQVPALPDGRHWIVTPLHVTCDDQEISFEAGAVVEAKRGAYHGLGDHLFHLDSVRNVSLVGYGATLKMWRQDYNDPSLYAHSEGRHAIAVLGAQDVSIRGLVVSESGGDGV